MRQWAWNVLVNGMAASTWFPQRLRPVLLRALGAEVGRAVIRRRVDLYGPALTIGDRVFINVGTQIQNYARVTLGDNVQIGPRVTILTVHHHLGGPERRGVGLIAKPVTIGSGTGLSSACTILPGVTIGGGCLIAAGAVVTKDCEPNGLYAGVPARRVRDLPGAKVPLDPSWVGPQ